MFGYSGRVVLWCRCRRRIRVIAFNDWRWIDIFLCIDVNVPLPQDTLDCYDRGMRGQYAVDGPVKMGELT